MHTSSYFHKIKSNIDGYICHVSGLTGLEKILKQVKIKRVFHYINEEIARCSKQDRSPSQSFSDCPHSAKVVVIQEVTG